MKKNFNKLATLALSGMMVMSMAMPAFAAPVEKTRITKRLHMDGDTYAPDTTFTFKVKKLSGEVTIDGKKYENLDAPANAVTVKPITFNRELGMGVSDTGEEGSHLDSTAHEGGQVMVDIDLLDKYGNYFFTLEEENGGYEGIRYSSHVKFYIVVNKYKDGNEDKVSVNIQREDKLKDTAVKISTIQNNYGKHNPPETPEFPKPDPSQPKPDPDPNDTTHDVVIIKKIGGQNGNKNDKFKFKIKVEAQDNKNERYKVQKVETNTTNNKLEDKGIFTGTNGFEFVDSGVDSPEFEVTEGTGIHIFGLTKNDKITVTESETDNSYTMDVAPKNQNKDKLSYVTGLTMVKKPDNTYEEFKAEFKTVKDKAEVVVQNNKGIITPTGIVMNVAPYALMLAVAGGMGVVFVNRKKEEE